MVRNLHNARDPLRAKSGCADPGQAGSDGQPGYGRASVWLEKMAINWNEPVPQQFVPVFNFLQARPCGSRRAGFFQGVLSGPPLSEGGGVVFARLNLELSAWDRDNCQPEFACAGFGFLFFYSPIPMGSERSVFFIFRELHPSLDFDANAARNGRVVVLIRPHGPSGTTGEECPASHGLSSAAL